MSAERTCDQERTLKITLELFMKGGFPNVMSVKRGSGGGEDLETTWVFFMKSVSNRCGECGKDL